MNESLSSLESKALFQCKDGLSNYGDNHSKDKTMMPGQLSASACQTSGRAPVPYGWAELLPAPVVSVLLVNVRIIPLELTNG